MPIDWSQVSDAELSSEVGRRNQAKRKTKGGGRPPKKPVEAPLHSIAWDRTLAFLRALGAPKPTWEMFEGREVAKFTKNGMWAGLFVYLAAKAPGVAATDLFANGIITLSEEAARFGGVPNLSIDELEALIPKLKGDRAK